MDVKLGRAIFKNGVNFYSNNFFRTAPINSNTVYAPVFSPTGGTFGSAQSVAMSSYTTGADIWYTTDGSTPSAGGGTSTLYSTAVSITVTTTLKAIAVKSGMTDSSVTSDTYTISAATPASAPTFGLAAGTYDRAMTQAITLSTSSAGASIYYTTDGSTPTTSSTLYTTAIPVDVTTTIKALASGGGFSDSSVSSTTYTITSPQLYVTCNGFNTGTSFVDSSGYGKTVTTNGNAQTSTAQSKFGGSSGLLDGTGDCLSFASSSDLGYGTGNFTIAAWFRPTSFDADDIFWDQRTADPQVKLCWIFQSGVPKLYVNGAIRITGSSALSTGAWSLMILSRLSGVTKLYINGVQSGSSYTDTNDYGASAPLVCGARFDSTLGCTGHISHLYSNKGTGITDAEALAWYSSGVAFAPHPNLLLHMDGTNGSTTFTDSSNLAATVTNNGSATVSTTSPKFGTGSGSFDGSNYLSLGGQSAYAFGSADFTIEGWFNPTGSGGSADSLIGFGPTGVDGVYPSIIRVSGNLCYYTNVGTRITGGSLTTNTWQHIALVRKAGVTNLYLEGVAQGTQYADTNVYLNGATRPLINGYGLAPGTLGMIGKTDELQIINGAAKYTANFTPPTRAFVA